MTKCKYCNSDTTEIYKGKGKQDSYSEYGEFKHKCRNCGAVGDEIFGHGIKWTKPEQTNFNSNGLNQGWICPKCGMVLNPNVQFCSCSVKITC